MSKQPGLKTSPGESAATKKTSFGPNQAGKLSSPSRGRDVFILVAGILVFLFVATFIVIGEVKKQGPSNQATVESAAVSESESSSKVQPEISQTAQDVLVQKQENDGADSSLNDPEEVCVGCMSEPQMLLTSRPDESKLRLAGVTDLRGRWVARMQDATAEAVFDQARFQIIYTGRHEGGIRRYVRGYYAFDESNGVISLKPAHKEEEPESVPGVFYQVLTLRYFDVIVRTDSGATFQYWTAPPDMLASRQIFPLLSFTGIEDNPYLVWEKVQ